MLLDSVFALALHHDRRARERPAEGFASTRVRADVSGPTTADAAPGGLRIEITITSLTAEGERDEAQVGLDVDLDEHRLLAPALALAELDIDRSSAARVIGELESWCYERLPMGALDPQPGEAPAAALAED